MKRFRITLEYDGGPYVGWQRQDNGRAVQEVVEAAIKDFCGETVTVYSAGRTDAGVHALAQVAHFDLEKDFEADKVQGALNYHLKQDPVSVIAAEIVDDDFHSRFSAIEREYLYRILNRRAKPALDLGRVWQIPVALDVQAMHRAAQELVGKHDFTTFRATRCQAKSAEKTLDELSVTRVGDEIHIKARARSFLHHQMRNITGTLKLVGLGKWNARDVRDALEARDRSRGGQTAPPDGLYLVRIGYETEVE